MCGRYTLRSPPQSIAQQFSLFEPPHDFQPRYNIAPTQDVLVVTRDPATGRNQLHWMRWGLVPSWAKDPAIGNRMINARLETAAAKPAFRSPFRHRRCLVIADGFYEWQRQGKRKQPFLMERHDHQPFAFAGLWDRWLDPSGQTIHSCAILTTDAAGPIKDIHERMPVILSPHVYNQWLDPDLTDPDHVMSLALTPSPGNESPPQALTQEAEQSPSTTAPPNAATPALYPTPVSTAVNSPANDSSDCVRSIG